MRLTAPLVALVLVVAGHAIAPWVPTDPLYPNQWHLEDINWLAACQIECGDADVVVAIIDTGVDYGHPDLDDNWIGGWDFVNNDADPMPGVGYVNQNTHGTMTAGVVAAEIGNAEGVAGVARVSLMGLRVDNDQPTQLRDAIDWARTHGADVISMSWHVLDENDIPLVEPAIGRAWDAGILLVAAGGNHVVPPESPCNYRGAGYPARDSRVLGVAGTNHAGAVSMLSYWGDGLEMAAPMEDIWSTKTRTTVPETGEQIMYGTDFGTSYATPQVAGVAALVLAVDLRVRPLVDSFTAADVYDIVFASGDQIVMDAAHQSCYPGIPPLTYAFRHLDALAAVQLAEDCADVTGCPLLQ